MVQTLVSWIEFDTAGRSYEWMVRVKRVFYESETSGLMSAEDDFLIRRSLQYFLIVCVC